MVVGSNCNDTMKQPRYNRMAEVLQLGYKSEVSCGKLKNLKKRRTCVIGKIICYLFAAA